MSDPNPLQADDSPLSDLAPLAPLTPRTAPAIHGGPWWARVWDAAVTYFPVLLVAALAAGSAWLLRTTPVAESAGGPAPVSNEPDYEMRGFSIERHAGAGIAQAVVSGERLRHFPQSDVIEIENARLRSVDELGRVTQATAQKALAQGDRSQYRLTGDAVVKREPGPGEVEGERFELRTDALVVDTGRNVLSTDRPVVLVTDGARIEAQGVVYDGTTQVAQLSGRIRAVFEPRMLK